MALSTYSELKTSIANWLNRDDLTAAIPDMITLTDADIWRNLRHWEMEKRATVAMDSQFTAIPDDILEPISLHLQGEDEPLEVLSANEMLAKRALTDDATGEPKYYALIAGEIEVYPTPGDTYTLEMLYYARPASLSDSNTVNWMLTQNPDVYLFGALMQAAAYLIDDKRIPVWEAKYDSALGELQSASDRAKFPSNLRLRVS